MPRFLMQFPIFAMLAFALVAAGCGGKKVEKKFPGGDLYEEMPRHAQESDGGTSEPNPPQDVQPIHLPENKREEKGVVLTVDPERQRVEAGTEFPVSMIIRNTNSEPAPVTYSSEKRFDLVVFADPDQRTPLFIWSEGRMFAQNFSEEFLGGGAARSRTLRIPTTDDETVREAMGSGLAAPLAPGTYYLWGTHEGEPYLAYGPQEIVVEEP